MEHKVCMYSLCPLCNWDNWKKLLANFSHPIHNFVKSIIGTEVLLVLLVTLVKVAERCERENWKQNKPHSYIVGKTKMAFTNPFAWWARRTIIAWSALEGKESSRIYIYLKETTCSQSIQCAWQLPLDLVYQWDLWDLLSLLDPVNLTQMRLMINTGYYNLIKVICHSIVDAIYKRKLLNCKLKELTVGPRCPLGPGLPCNPWEKKFTGIILVGTLFVI